MIMIIIIIVTITAVGLRLSDETIRVAVATGWLCAGGLKIIIIILGDLVLRV